MTHILAGGSGQLLEGGSHAMLKLVRGLTAKERPRVLYVPTARGDRPPDIVDFYQTFDSDLWAPHHLNLFGRDHDELASFITGFDVVLVAGGNTANLLDIWRRHGVDKILREMFEDPANTNVVFAGGSAGAMCWFEGGTTDSYGPTLRVLPEGMGLLKGSFCPHYDAEGQRQPLYHQAVLSGELPAGYACGELDLVHFDGTRFVTAISSSAHPLALRVEARAGEVVETPLPVKGI